MLTRFLLRFLSGDTHFVFFSCAIYASFLRCAIKQRFENPLKATHFFAEQFRLADAPHQVKPFPAPCCHFLCSLDNTLLGLRFALTSLSSAGIRLGGFAVCAAAVVVEIAVNN